MGSITYARASLAAKVCRGSAAVTSVGPLFLHSLGPSRHIALPHKLDRSQGKADIANSFVALRHHGVGGQAHSALIMWTMLTSEAPAFLAVVAALTALALAI
jgi:hypothetical protein